MSAPTRRPRRPCSAPSGARRTGTPAGTPPAPRRAPSPVNGRPPEPTSEPMFGARRRPTHGNTGWDAARFEVSAHRFCDLSEPGYGVALLNDGKYGHSAKGNLLGISLLRSPLYPDPLADEGEHRFTYSLYPHPGDWTAAGVTREAFALNSPLVPVRGGGAPGGSPGGGGGGAGGGAVGARRGRSPRGVRAQQPPRAGPGWRGAGGIVVRGGGGRGARARGAQEVRG